MMCTAAVCPISPPHPPFLGYGEEGTDVHNGRWRSANSSKGLATFMLNLSPLSDRCDLLQKSRFNVALDLLVHKTEPETREKFDIISKLPVEISLNILKYLSEQDLCSICLVSKKWYSMAQDTPLKRRRDAYVTSQRIHYKLSKENYFNGEFSSPRRSSFIISRTTPSPALYPLNNRFATPTQRYNTGLPAFNMNSNNSSNAMSSVVDRVQRLTIQGKHHDVRRCLFPGLESPGMKRSNCTDNLVGPSSRRREEQTPPTHVCKKSKARLRRL